MTIRSQGEWLYHQAALGESDWQSAAIALRQDVARLGDEKAALVRALEQAWAKPTAEPEDDGIFAFTAEVSLVR